jgi:hypothetical protein
MRKKRDYFKIPVRTARIPEDINGGLLEIKITCLGAYLSSLSWMSRTGKSLPARMMLRAVTDEHNEFGFRTQPLTAGPYP